MTRLLAMSLRITVLQTGRGYAQSVRKAHKHVSAADGELQAKLT